MSKWKTSRFQKNFIPILWIFSGNKCILVRLWVSKYPVKFKIQSFLFIGKCTSKTPPQVA